jgi:hypothetical protein
MLEASQLIAQFVGKKKFKKKLNTKLIDVGYVCEQLWQLNWV